ncbi:hypothetical protein HRbin04_00492 [archaeon HR04]|nr:hypothetical protein HRbin04_00492 [archaeon HR04]
MDVKSTKPLLICLIVVLALYSTLRAMGIVDDTLKYVLITLLSILYALYLSVNKNKDLSNNKQIDN